MIPGPIVASTPVLPLRQPRAGLAARVAVVVLVMASVVGALAWFTTLSPYSLRRWTLFDPMQDLKVTEPGEYIVFEEAEGSSERVGPALLAVSVRSIGGKKIETASLIDSTGHSPITYKTPWNDGRAVASFVIDKPGSYSVLGYPTNTAMQQSGNDDPGARLLDLTKVPRIALAPQGRPGRLGTVEGLVVLSVTPLLMAGLVGLYARRRWPSPLRSRRGGGRRRRREGNAAQPVPVGAASAP